MNREQMYVLEAQASRLAQKVAQPEKLQQLEAAVEAAKGKKDAVSKPYHTKKEAKQKQANKLQEEMRQIDREMQADPAFVAASKVEEEACKKYFDAKRAWEGKMHEVVEQAVAGAYLKRDVDLGEFQKQLITALSEVRL